MPANLDRETISHKGLRVQILPGEGANLVSFTVDGTELIYWDELYNAGAKDTFDILSANAYGLDQAPDAAPSKDVLNFRRVELLHDIMVEHGDGNASFEYLHNPRYHELRARQMAIARA